MNPTQRTCPISGSLIRTRAGGLLSLLSLLALSIAANGATLIWVPAGAGDWDAISNRWDADGPGGVLPSTWVQRDIAVFGGPSSGEVSIVTPIEASRVIFNTDGYVISGGALTMIEQNPGDFVDFVADGLITGTVNSVINSPGDVWVNFFGETGTVIFGADNAYLGKTSVRGGVLELGGTLGSPEIDVETNATLRLTGDDFLDDSAVVKSGAIAPGGTVELSGDDTIGSYLSDGGLLDGTGILTADTYNLSNGASSNPGANLGAGQLNTSGVAEVTLGGNSAAEDVNVDSGTLNLNGELTDVTDLTISPDATVKLGSDQRINDDAVVNNNEGTLELGGAESVKTYNATGQLGGSGTLTAEEYHLRGGASTLAGANLGTGQLTSGPGVVTLAGNAAAEAVDVVAGTLNLNGELTGVADLTISGGATLTSGAADRVADAAEVTIEDGATWNLGGSDSIGLLISKGGLLSGKGTLSADQYDLSNGAVTAAGADLGAGQLLSGPGVVTLNGDAAAEDVAVLSGTLNLNGELTGATDVTISNGASLASGSADRVADGAAVTLENGSKWKLNGDDTIGRLNSSGLLNGGSTLTAGQYNLSNGAEVPVGTNLGSGQLTSGPGIVNLNGDAAAEDVDVNRGTLNLNGQLTTVADLAIANGATLLSGSADRLADAAIVNLANGGTWTLGGNEQVGVFNSSGLLNGGSTLTASEYHLSNGAIIPAGNNLGMGLLTSGPGVVELNGDAAASALDVLSGTLNLNGELTDVTDLTISDGGAFISGDADRVADGATVNLANGGTMTLGGNETVNELNSSGLLNGSGVLTAGSYHLSNGAETASGADLGAGQLSSGPGEVTVGGDSAAEDVDINSGTLNLNGELTGVRDLELSNGATLVSGSADRVADAATVNLANGGVWTLSGNDLVSEFKASGLLNGAGVLAATNYNLSNGAATSAGANLGSGQLNSGPGEVTLGGDAAAEDVNVTSGTLNLNGQLSDVSDLTVSHGATLVSGSADRIADSAVVNLENGGTLTLGGHDLIGRMHSSGLLTGSGTLTATQYLLSNGAVTSNGAKLGSGQLVSGPGEVTLNGDASSEDVDVVSGKLDLNGQLTGVTDLSISSGATLNLGASERINDGAVLNNFGELNLLAGTETVARYQANGGLLVGAGLLQANQYNLRNGAVTAAGANLGTGELKSGPGSVILNGNTNADALNVIGGSLTSNGAVLNQNGVISLASEGTWFVNSGYIYDSLRGFGTVDPGGVNGNVFTNSANLRPGTSIGSLAIVGDYVEAGTFHGELDPTNLGSPYLLSDNLTVSGSTTLTGLSTLSVTGINGLTSAGVGIGHRFALISSAGGILGKWGEITDGNNTGPGSVTFASQLLFNTATGDLWGLGLTGLQTPADYAGANPNHVAILNSVTDGATDRVGNYDSTDGAEGTVLDAIYRTGAPGDVQARLKAVDAVSPEGYAGALDYTLHATRSYAQSLRNATPLVSDSKYSLVAGFHHFNLGSSSSRNSNDFSFNSNGGYLGARSRGNDELVYGGFLASASGSIDAGRADLDASGLVYGGFLEYHPGHAQSLSYWGSMAYGAFEFDGTRPGLVSRLATQSFDGTAFQGGFGVDYRAYQKNGVLLIPRGSLNFISTDVDGFTETGGADALIVDSQDASATYLELSLRAQYQVPNVPLTFVGELGWQHNFRDVDRDISATLGNSSFNVNAPGLGAEAVIFALGINYDLNEQFQIGLHYRGEFRGDAEAFSGLNLSVKAAF
jgi:fibronectin-binding autotransporter adhesin